MRAYLLSALLLLSPGVFAESLDPASQEALQRTQGTLIDPLQREKAFGDDKLFKQMDSDVRELSGNDANKQQMYNITAKVLENLVKETNGDADAMKKIIDEAQRDPEGFLKKHVDQKNRDHIRQLATDIEKIQPPPAPKAD